MNLHDKWVKIRRRTHTHTHTPSSDRLTLPERVEAAYLERHKDGENGVLWARVLNVSCLIFFSIESVLGGYMELGFV